MNETKEEKIDKDCWTKEEMTIYSNGAAALARAVIKQWTLDGKPARDTQAIEQWKNILQEAQEK